MANEIPHYFRADAESIAKRCKKAELTEQLARALYEKNKADDKYREVWYERNALKAALEEFESIKDAIALIKEARCGKTTKEILSDLLDNSVEIIEAVKEREAEDMVIEDLEEDRERMLRALKMTEDEWSRKGWRY